MFHLDAVNLMKEVFHGYLSQMRANDRIFRHDLAKTAKVLRADCEPLTYHQDHDLTVSQIVHVVDYRLR
jgi:hypothetical protein